MAKGIPHSEETRAAVMAALLAGQSTDAVARAYRIPLGTVKGWAAEVRRAAGVDVVGDRRERIGDLILSNLETLLVAVEEIVKSVSADKEWLRQQSASELAVLVGVLSDKAFRILEALPESVEDGSLLAGGEGESAATGG